MVLFPLLLALVTMVSTIGLQFLVGDSAAQTSDTEANSFTWQELSVCSTFAVTYVQSWYGNVCFHGP